MASPCLILLIYGNENWRYKDEAEKHHLVNCMEIKLFLNYVVIAESGYNDGVSRSHTAYLWQ